MNTLLGWLLLADDLPLPIPVEKDKLLLYGGGAGGVLILFTIVWLMRGKRKHDPEAGLSEKLAEYPPPPAQGRLRLTVQGQPVRLRLVVVAPVGKKPISGDAAVEPLLDKVVRGLGEVARQDKPRIRVWPTQLSSAGFAPTFHRLTHKPEGPGRPSRWILLAGPARAEEQQLLLGLAVLADKNSKLDMLTLEPLEWVEALRVENA
jgi:hypothetical protein